MGGQLCETKPEVIVGGRFCVIGGVENPVECPFDCFSIVGLGEVLEYFRCGVHEPSIDFWIELVVWAFVLREKLPHPFRALLELAFLVFVNPVRIVPRSPQS
jgi:hypothetical protein